MMKTLDTARLMEGLEEQTAGFARAVAGSDPDMQVPTCPGWPLRTLIGHVGQQHRWTAELVRTGEQLTTPDPQQADPGAPGEWARWLHEGAQVLIHAIRQTGADTEIRTFLGPRPAAFCLRRMLSDTCVHHYDAAFATDTAFRIADDLAADVISEILDLLSTPALETAKPEIAELRGRGEKIGFRPTLTQGWVITRTPEGLRGERGPVEADVVVSGAVADLMLVVSRRIPPKEDRVSVQGDRALLDHWLARTAL
ncbi:maleylpyruvate isomerase family mycothiol-dependent enzyme [Streptomyces sp. H27-C3]|uniref:maleylpyruvate isomerase family mycothiol-dependent enzyme n=1 Tax=Streptomyces sp. H27-C3 TaxID=3046305 RepID=UPI0024B9E9AE|nr:maleylpyruvate isomerase family mycothiol-dependent enzyme [Streptomyces sp. H27-C3]MDJ0463776.1 maleylpyruvate isomerase family mycothiol-dependent enzyme [Streptomyces sp. H27-C3]